MVCESLMGALQGVMADPNVDADFNHQLELACMRLPHALRTQVTSYILKLSFTYVFFAEGLRKSRKKNRVAALHPLVGKLYNKLSLVQ